MSEISRVVIIGGGFGGLEAARALKRANRLLVLVQWAWNYATWNRAARLITGEAARPAAMLRGPDNARSAPENVASPSNRMPTRARLR
jgi:NADH dehydrogenase FAD-containing subunit